MTSKDRVLLSATESFVFRYEGADQNVNVGDQFYSDDPMIRGLHHLFKPFAARREPDVWEAATAAPGEKREQIGHPKRSTEQ